MPEVRNGGARSGLVVCPTRSPSPPLPAPASRRRPPRCPLYRGADGTNLITLDHPVPSACLMRMRAEGVSLGPHLSDGEVGREEQSRAVDWVKPCVHCEKRQEPTDCIKRKLVSTAPKNQNKDSVQPNPETKRTKYIFSAHFETNSKTHFVASWLFWYRCQNDLQKYWVWVFLCRCQIFPCVRRSAAS